jgi:hypothetical protein
VTEPEPAPPFEADTTREHLIRLRGGWDRQAPSDPQTAGKIALPLTSSPAGSVPVWLVRHFQTPPIDVARESLWLRLSDCPGVVSVVLNAREIARPGPSGEPLILPINLEPAGRNRLELLVEPPVRPDTSNEPTVWGHVALVIRPRSPKGNQTLGGGLRGP